MNKDAVNRIPLFCMQRLRRVTSGAETIHLSPKKEIPMSAYVKPSIVSVVRASKAIAIGANGSNPSTKMGTLQDCVDAALSRSTSGAYQADE
jgi:hypothetical protein